MTTSGLFDGLDGALNAYEKIVRLNAKDYLVGPAMRAWLYPDMTDEQADKIRAWVDTAPISHLMDALGAPR